MLELYLLHDVREDHLVEILWQDDSLQVTPDGQAWLLQQLHGQVGLHVVSWNFNELAQIDQPQHEVLFEEAVDYLGFEVSRHGIGTVKAYTEAIRQIKMPETVIEMKSLIGKFRTH